MIANLFSLQPKNIKNPLPTEPKNREGYFTFCYTPQYAVKPPSTGMIAPVTKLEEFSSTR